MDILETVSAAYILHDVLENIYWYDYYYSLLRQKAAQQVQWHNNTCS